MLLHIKFIALWNSTDLTGWLPTTRAYAFVQLPCWAPDIPRHLLKLYAAYISDQCYSAISMQVVFFVGASLTPCEKITSWVGMNPKYLFVATGRLDCSSGPRICAIAGQLQGSRY